MKLNKLKNQHFKYLILLIIFLLPAYQIRFTFLNIPCTLLELIILITFSIWLIQNYKQIINNIKYKLNNKKSNFEIQKSKLIRYPYDWEIIALLSISLLGVIIADFNNAALGVWKAYFFEPLIFYILVLNVFKPQKNQELISEASDINSFLSPLYWSLSVLAFSVSIIAVFQKLTGYFTVEHFLPRITGPYPYPNALGLLLGPIVIILIAWLFSNYSKSNIQRYPEYKKKILFVFITIFISILAIIFAKSDGALIGVAAALAVFGFFVNKFFRKITIVFCVFGILILSGMFYFVRRSDELKLGNIDSCICEEYPQAIEISRKIVNKLRLKDLSGEIRKQQWRETWTMMTDSPARFIFGTGLSGYQQAIKPYHQEGIFFNHENDPDFRRKIVWWDKKYKAEHWQPVEIYMYPHNILLNFWTELGLLGSCLFIWIIGKFFYTGIKTIRYLYRNQMTSAYLLLLGLICSMIVIIVHGLVDVPYFKNDLSLLFWLIIALPALVNLSKENPIIKNK